MIRLQDNKFRIMCPTCSWKSLYITGMSRASFIYGCPHCGTSMKIIETLKGVKKSERKKTTKSHRRSKK